MRAFKRRHSKSIQLWLSLALVILLCLAGCTVNKAGLAANTAAQSSMQQQRFSTFSEPLVPIGPANEIDDQELDSALTAYSKKSKVDIDQVDDLELYLKKHPQSRWTASLQFNLGMLYHQSGHFSLSLASLRDAWKLSQSASDPQGRALADRCLGELAISEAYLGHYENLEPLLEQARQRKVSGPATELLSCAATGLANMQKHPERSFMCGPKALSRICHITRQNSKKQLEVLSKAKSTKRGTSLSQVFQISKDLGINYQMAYRSPGAAVLGPAVVHWKVGHFAALNPLPDGRYEVVDCTDGTYGKGIRLKKSTLDTEASGYFLVPSGPLPSGWRSVDSKEGEDVWGRGDPGQRRQEGATGPGDATANSGGCAGGSGGAAGAGVGAGVGTGIPMATWDVHLMAVSLKLSDTPVGRSPGAFTVPFQLTYCQREIAQPSNFNYTNFGPKWTCNWVSFVNDDISSTGGASIYEAGGGLEFCQFDSGSSQSRIGRQSKAFLTKISGGGSPRFERTFADGSRQIFAQAQGSRYFLTRVEDEHGNATVINYDSQMRITSVLDPVGRSMSFSYEGQDPLKVTKVTDPFGRSAQLTYSADGHLASIQDILGIVSSFEYGSNDFVKKLTTPYGVTSFDYADYATNPGLSPEQRILTISDPAGRSWRAESVDRAPGVPYTENLVPQGVTEYWPNYMNYRNTYFWQPQQLTGSLDYTKSTAYHFVHHMDDPNSQTGFSQGRTLESVKRPLQNRVWYTHEIDPDNANRTNGLFLVLPPTWEGRTDLPTSVAQVLSDGSTQVTRTAYNSKANSTSYTDALGRVFTYTYAANEIDLLSISTGGKTLFAAAYDNNHNITSLTDASGSTTSYTYNSRGQMLTSINIFNETTTYNYSDNGNLLSISEPLGKTTTFAYDSAERLASATDSEGYTVTANYDQADRPVSVTYPDGTNETINYNLLDTASTVDRLGRKTSMIYDSVRRLTQVTDPKDGIVGLDYGTEESPTTITDQGGRQTQFAYDLQQRLISKQYAGGATQSITYQSCCGRLRRVTDALGHTKTFDYYLDNTLKSITYSGSTPAVNFTNDPFLPRPLTMTDGQGTTSYNYVPVGSPGANGLQSVTGPLGDQASFQYDAASRMTGRTVNGSAESQVFDPLWRTTSTTNPLDTFNMTYLGKTGQVTGVTSASGPTSQFTYQPNTNDRRLAQIKNLGRVSGTVMSQFDFTQDSMGQITKLVESHDSATTGGGTGGDCHKKCCHDKKKCCKEDCCKKKCCEGKGKCGKHDCKTHHGNGKGGDDDDDDDHHHSLVFPFTGQSLQIACLLGIFFASSWMMVQIVRDRSKVRPIFARVTSLLLLGTVFLNGCLGSAPTTTTMTSTTQDFSYDDLGQLIGISVNNTPSASFQFDPSGNLVSLTSGGTTSAFTYNSLNQPTTPAGNTFDAKGQTTVSGGKTFEWDDEGRLTAIVNGSARSEFGYDGYGRRISITEKSGTTVTSKKLYWWLGGSIVCERDGLAAGNPITKRYFGQGVLVGAQKLFYTFDQLGSVRELVDDTGAIRADYRYDNYGTRTKASGDLDSDFGYAGLFHHAPSGLLLATHRAYDPVSHRWLSRDPLGEGVDLNLYRYCGNNPVSRIDPSGLIALAVELTHFRQTEYGDLLLAVESNWLTLFPRSWFVHPTLEVVYVFKRCGRRIGYQHETKSLGSILLGIGSQTFTSGIPNSHSGLRQADQVQVLLRLRALDQNNTMHEEFLEKTTNVNFSPNGTTSNKDCECK
jgi:RHS repeat-associated protein